MTDDLFTPQEVRIICTTCRQAVKYHQNTPWIRVHTKMPLDFPTIHVIKSICDRCSLETYDREQRKAKDGPIDDYDENKPLMW